VKQSVGNDVTKDTPLMDAGVDSLAASELVQLLSGEFSVELSATLLFDHPSVASISTHVALLVAAHVGTMEREISLVEEI
jgi:acyl carrier protein